MRKKLPLSQWDSVSMTALVWCKQLLSSSGITVAPPPDLWAQATSDDLLIRAALSRHRIIPPAAAWLSDELSAPVSVGTRDWLATERKTNQRQVIAHVAAAARLQRALSEAGIKALFIKGPFQAKQATGDPAGRGSGDLDLFVEPDKYEQALETLISVGAILMDKQLSKPLAQKVAQVHHATTFLLSGISIDLHRRLDPNPDRMRLSFDTLWRERDTVQLAGVDFATLSPIDACVLVASHGCRDNWLQIRQLVDFAQSLNRIQSEGFDFSDLEQRAVEQGVARRLAVALAVTHILVPELPVQSDSAKQLAQWTWSRYRSGRVDIGARTPRHAVSMLTYSALSEEGLQGLVYSARRLIWFTSTNVDPLFPNQSLWTYPLLAPVNVVRRMLKPTRPNEIPQSRGINSLDLTSREHLLLMIGMETHPSGAKEAWQKWRVLVPDFNGVTSVEISLLPIAWQKANAAGAMDPASGRLNGLQRRAYVHASAVLAEAARVQQSLADRGIRSELTGVATAALEYSNLSRWPLLRAELWIDSAERDAAIATATASTAERILGRRQFPNTSTPIALTWRQPDRELGRFHFSDTNVIDWQGRALRVAPPHIAALHVLVRALPASRPGTGASLIALLDLHLLSQNPLFNREVFIDLRRKSVWRGLFTAHARAGIAFLPPDLIALLSDSITVQTSDASVRDRTPIQVGQDLIAHNMPRAFSLGVRALS